MSSDSIQVVSYIHADIRTLASSEESIDRQVALVKAFAEDNLLKLNVNKCEIVLFSRGQNIIPPACVVEGSVIPASDEGKCLGYWWRGNLLATKSVDENIRKARSAFFTMAALVSSRAISVHSHLSLCWSAV